MMQALRDSGITPHYDRIRELGLQMNNDKYAVNKAFLEVGSCDYKNIKWNASVPDGRCMKIGLNGIKYFTPGVPAKVILMGRDPEAIKRSFNKFLPDFDGTFTGWPHSYYRIMTKARDRLNKQNWVDWVEIDYHDLIDDPETELIKIKSLGVPINVKASIDLLKPELCRCR